MNKKITIFGLITVALVLGFLVFRLTPGWWQIKTLVSPGTPSPTPLSIPNAPKTFQFDSSTDLKTELEKVDPEVLDSDFE